MARSAFTSRLPQGRDGQELSHTVYQGYAVVPFAIRILLALAYHTGGFVSLQPLPGLHWASAGFGSGVGNAMGGTAAPEMGTCEPEEHTSHCECSEPMYELLLTI